MLVKQVDTYPHESTNTYTPVTLILKQIIDLVNVEWPVMKAVIKVQIQETHIITLKLQMPYKC